MIQPTTMNNKKKWINEGSEFYFNDIPKVSNALPVGVYELNFDIRKGFFLIKTSDDFQMPEKVYGVETDLIDRIIKTYKAVDKNFGVLLQGLKGTGKTVTAKMVSNLLKIPVILVNKAYRDIGTFVNSVDQDLILFFDEFEKVYEFSSFVNDDGDQEDIENKSKPNVSSLLTLMDGVFTSDHKRLFLMTTNKEYLPDPMLSRPSRIRYIKKFGDLSYENIMEVLNDSVKNKELIPGLIKILSELEIITIDIVKAVAEESNIYNTADPAFFEIFNIKSKTVHYDIFLDEEKTPLEERYDIDPSKWKRGRTLGFGQHYFRITKVVLNGDEKYFEVLKQVPSTGKFSEKTHKLTFKVHKHTHKNIAYAYDGVL